MLGICSLPEDWPVSRDKYCQLVSRLQLYVNMPLQYTPNFNGFKNAEKMILFSFFFLLKYIL